MSGRSDDREAIERAVASCSTYLMFVAGKLKGPDLPAAEGASDLVQKTLMVALKQIRDGDERLLGRPDEEVRAYLRAILKNVLRDTRRHYRALKRSPAAPPPAPAPLSPSGEAMLREEARRLEEALGGLAPEDREIIHWREVEGLTFGVIGRRRGYSETYAGRMYREAKGRLESALAGGTRGFIPR